MSGRLVTSMQKIRYRSMRGQVLPVWILAIIANLAFIMLIFNLTNAIRWQIRAQNAADSVASYTLAQVGSLYNQETTELYAVQVNEYRIRALYEALKEEAAKTSPSLTQLNAIQTGLNAAMLNGHNIFTYLPFYLVPSQAPHSQGEYVTGSATQLPAGETPTTSGCGGGKLPVDCAFGYTINYHHANTPTKIEVVACKKVATKGASILKIANNPFTAIGRSDVKLASKQIAFSPGVASFTTLNGQGEPVSHVFQPTEAYGTFTLDFSKFKVQSNMFEIVRDPVPANPPTAVTC